MRKSEFIEYVRSPEVLTCDKTVELQELVNDFPWFQTAQVLLCRNLNVCENMGFEKQLRIAAAYSTDRVRLHQLVMERVVSIEHETKVEDKTPDSSDQQEKEELIGTSENYILEEKNTATIERTKEKYENSSSPEDDFLNKQILSHAISNSNLLQDEEQKNADSIPIEFNEHIKLSNEPIEENETVEPVDKFDENAPHSFTEWLKHIDDPTKENSAQEEQGKDEIGDEFSFENKEELSSLISSQITPKKKASFYNPTEMAKLSVKEDDDLISETLAKIYAQQGNYEKAINAYKKLSLKYPEKKIYFANQIQTLEENLNS